MNSLFRCANCAHIIKKPDSKCPECGFQREMSKPTVRKWYVYLENFGNDSQKIKFILSGKLGKSEAEINSIHQNMPVRILTTNKKHKAEHIASLLSEAGASVRVSAKPYSKVKPDESEPDQYFHQDSDPEKKKFSWLLPLIAIIPVVMTFLPELVEKLPVITRKAVYHYIEEEFSRFEDALIIVTANDMEAGHVITSDDLKVQVIERKNAPHDAIPPLHADQLIGKTLKNSITKDQILTLECVTDNERPF